MSDAQTVNPLQEQIIALRTKLATGGLELAQELEAGRATTPFQNVFRELGQKAISTPIRAVVIGANPETTYALLSDILGQDYNVCKVVVPSRLGYSEISLHERGYLLDTGAGAREFADPSGFLTALEEARILQQNDTSNDLEPLRLRLQAPAHLSGLCLLVPHSLDALVSKPALLSTLADQADWVFLAGTKSTQFTPEQKQAIQIILQNVTGLQNVMHTPTDAPAETEAGEEWWKAWRVTLSLGLVAIDTELLRTRLGLLTLPASELRQYLVESRLLSQVETNLTLLSAEFDQAQRLIKNRQTLAREGLTGPSSSADLRKSMEGLRNRITEETDSILKALQRDAKSALAIEGPVNERLRTCAEQIEIDDIEQSYGSAAIKLTLGPHFRDRLKELVTEISRAQLAQDLDQLREGLECSARDAAQTMENITGMRQPLAIELPDVEDLWHALAANTHPEVRYRGEMPRPTLGSRLSSARQGIMGILILGTVLGGAAVITGGDAGSAQNIRTVLYALMLPLLIIGFLWTYVSFRKKERITLEKEVDKLHEGVFAELRRLIQEVFRDQQQMLAATAQKCVRGLQQQIDEAFSQLEKQNQQSAEELRKRQQDQQRALEARAGRLRQFASRAENLSRPLDEARKLLERWLNEWIAKFNQKKV